MCTSVPYHITMKTRILGAQIYFKNISSFSKYNSSILKCNFKYISEKYIKPVSDKYIKSKLKVYFLIFSLNEVY